MSFQWLRRALLTAACVSPLLLAACGGGSVESEFRPSRLVVFGDAFADAGQRGARYTVNNGGTNWTEQLAARYGLAVAAQRRRRHQLRHRQRAGERSSRTPAAMPRRRPSPSRSTPSWRRAHRQAAIWSWCPPVSPTSSRRCAADRRPRPNANVKQAGRDLGAQVRRLVNAGATHIAVSGPYNLGRSPWATAASSAANLQDLSVQFNNELLISIVDLGAKVLYVDAALYFNLVTSNPGTYGFTDVGSVICTGAAVDPGPGIGIGVNQVNSALCNAGTLIGRAPSTPRCLPTRSTSRRPARPRSATTPSTACASAGNALRASGSALRYQQQGALRAPCPFGPLRADAAGRQGCRRAQSSSASSAGRRPPACGWLAIATTTQRRPLVAVHVAGHAEHVAQAAALEVRARRRLQPAQGAVAARQRQRSQQLRHQRRGPRVLQQARQLRRADARVARQAGAVVEQPAAAVADALAPPGVAALRARLRGCPCRVACRLSVRNSCCAITLLLNLLMSRTTSDKGGEACSNSGAQAGRHAAVADLAAERAADLLPQAGHGAAGMAGRIGEGDRPAALAAGGRVGAAEARLQRRR